SRARGVRRISPRRARRSAGRGGALRQGPRARAAGRRRPRAPDLGAADHRPRRQRLRAPRAPPARRAQVSCRSLGRARVWAIAFCWVMADAAAARAQDPAPAVDVTVVGTADDLERVRALAPRLGTGGARWLRVDRLDPADVLRARRDGDAAAVRAWVDITVATRARLYFATRSGERFLVRDLELSGRFDEVDRAALTEVLESSIGALIADERAGLTRAEAEAVIARREPPSP